ncbi:S49 family peptidase [Siphonobacter sp. SORGH_AS_0500]|uniref:S49 family peptidase n=1 Tax=Siphonobacter sp. SORGH_AS_0500 TaxID=1864824 RepID=UPI0028610C54|nr:S49 family peptidase [Siphonobacter sp. SORGH_AS_0500]MDR6194739.1 protease-4 [Siphonobacter sp. SORGH_AS_0500]
MNALCERYWAMQPGAAAALMLGVQANGLKIESRKANMKTLRVAQDNETVGGNAIQGRAGQVAVISMMGAMTRYGDLCAFGTDEYIDQINQANADDSVSAIVIRADSPGGTVNGIETLALAVRNSAKPVVAWVAGGSFSANYWVISQCAEIFLESKISSEVGSIGVYSIQEDWTEALQKQGRKVTIVRAEGCDEKVALNPFEVAPEGALEAERAVATSIFKLFKAQVKEVRPQVDDEAMKGRTYQGFEALKNGLADKIGTLREAMKRADQLGRQKRRQHS